MSWLGDGARRLDLAPGVDARRALAALRGIAGVRDVVCTETQVAVHFDAPEAPPGLEAALARAAGSPEPAPRRLTIRARYDGPDLERVAEWAKLSPEEVVRRHAGQVYVVKMIGFLPGFAYLGEVPAEIAAPRLAFPRKRVAPGAIGIAGERTAVYPFASPGGWNLIGTALDSRLFDAEAGARLAAGDEVVFEVA